MSLRYFAISTVVLALLVVTIEVLAALALPDIGASIERSKRRGDPELRDFDLPTWNRMALAGTVIASSLSVAFVVAGVGLLRHRRWARILFVAASFGVLAFMIASCVHHVDFVQVLHVAYASALQMFGWWFLFRSRVSASFAPRLQTPASSAVVGGSKSGLTRR